MRKRITSRINKREVMKILEKDRLFRPLFHQDGTIDKRYINSKNLAQTAKYMKKKYRMDTVEALDFVEVIVDMAGMGDSLFRRFKKMMMEDHDERKDHDYDEGPDYMSRRGSSGKEKIARKLVRLARELISADSDLDAVMNEKVQVL